MIDQNLFMRKGVQTRPKLRRKTKNGLINVNDH